MRVARRFGVVYWLGVLLVAAWGLVQLAPILWMISTSLKPLSRVFALAMLGLPDSLVEAARIDGAGELGTYFRIVVPLIWPAVLTLAIFTWRETWDAFVWPFIIISEDSLRTVPIGLQRFQEQYVTTYNSVMAISTIAMIPLVLLFFFFQRAFIRGLALSGLKD